MIDLGHRKLKNCTQIVLLVLVLVHCANSQVTSDDAASQSSLASASQWDLEEVRLIDGRVLNGLIDSNSGGELLFIEVARPPGKRAYLVVRRPIEHSQVRSIKRLKDDKRKILIARIAKVRNRSRIEAGRMARIEIKKKVRDGHAVFTYRGPWFALRSTADEETTRRSIVRIEQVFTAYRRIIAPRRKPDRELKILLHGTEGEYRDYVDRLSIKIENPAFYSPKQNLIAAGSDLHLYAEQLRKARRENELVYRQYREKERRLPAVLAKLTTDLEKQGFNKTERVDEVLAVRTRFQKELTSLRNRIAASERRNLSRFNKLTREMFTRLYHEAFHAYLENQVFNHRDPNFKVPRWLNEGLAQVFESGQIEADMLRIDAANRETLAALKADLRRGKPLSIKELLEADQDLFLISHAGAKRASSRHYLYSWGLTYYLTFGTTKLNLTGIKILAKTGKPPKERFEKLVGMPIEEFERQWHNYMLRLSHDGTVVRQRSSR